MPAVKAGDPPANAGCAAGSHGLRWKKRRGRSPLRRGSHSPGMDPRPSAGVGASDARTTGCRSHAAAAHGANRLARHAGGRPTDQRAGQGWKPRGHRQSQGRWRGVSAGETTPPWRFPAWVSLPVGAARSGANGPDRGAPQVLDTFRDGGWVAIRASRPNSICCAPNAIGASATSAIYAPWPISSSLPVPRSSASTRCTHCSRTL